jgi:hypothetical protein
MVAPQIDPCGRSRPYRALRLLLAALKLTAAGAREQWKSPEKFGIPGIP